MCDNKNDNQISLHKFPSEISVKKKWICRLRIGKQLPKNAAVCSSHFRVEDFTSIRRKNNHSMLYIVRKHKFNVNCFILRSYFVAGTGTDIQRRRLLPDAIPSANLPETTLDQQMHRLSSPTKSRKQKRAQRAKQFS